ncbi:MAG: ATP-binding protein [Caldilineales bacterium]|nr:ATP-binding protein [Caldilineales bacterium]MCW5860265.1 ATP-binding protein [Caldilineales bacterium]
MTQTTFVGRRTEMALLDSLWASPAATMLILYGRRRVGKTRLLTQWLQRSGKRTLYWVAEPSSAADQLRSFSQAIYNFAHPEHPAPDDFTFASWPQAWQQVVDLTAQEGLALFLDEFTYLLEVDASIAGKLQNNWDHVLSQANLFLVLSGSHLGMMQRQLLSYQAPLYGRATAQMKLQPLPFGVTKAYFPGYRADERVAVYALLGGIPAYWERLNPQATISDNIRQQLLTPNNLMQAEPRLLLADFVTEPHNYVGILGAIAHGARTQSEIATRTGLAQGHVSKYLSVLRDAGFIERRIPVTAEETTRQGRYHIVDPYLRFYYRFLATRQAQLALGIQEQALAEITRHLLDFIGAHTWEELCREWVLRASSAGQLPYLVDQVGSSWTKTSQVDIVGINALEKTLILGECKWSPKQMGHDVLMDLVAKTASVVPRSGRWRVYYLSFAGGGWEQEANELAWSITAQPPRGDNWAAEGMRLLDLQQVDEDLVRWEGSAI